MNKAIRRFGIAGQRQPTSISQDQLIEIERPAERSALPVVIHPVIEGIDLVAWAGNNLSLIEKNLSSHGAILFRNFQVKDTVYFEQVIKAVSGDLLEYTYRSTPRSRVGGNIYTSTEYPADQFIQLHNENSYASSWPMKIWFCCEQPAERGGETPLADSRRVFQRLDPQLKKHFIRKKVMYVRNHGGALDLSWQTVFQTTDRAAVEAYCRHVNLDYQWQEGDRLRTKQICQAVAVHPHTGEDVWFNQAHLFHPSSLQAEVNEYLQANYSSEDLPRNAHYGDGSPIEESALAEIRAVYQQEAAIFGWQKKDVLLLDNMLMAHGRTPFSGPRRVLAGLSEPYHTRETTRET